jgi:hypothetical protein
MTLFNRHAARARDLRDRYYVLTGCPLVAQDDMVVLVDVTVRLHVREATDDTKLTLGYDPTEQPALHAVFVLVLRLLAGSVPSDELLVGRTRLVEALEQGFSFAPIGAGLDAVVTTVEVRPYDQSAAGFHHEFRTADS